MRKHKSIDYGKGLLDIETEPAILPKIQVIHTPPLVSNETPPWAAPAELPSLKGVKRLAIDTETCDPDLGTLGPGFRRGAYIVGLALGMDDGRRVYLPTRHEGGGNLDEALVKRWAKEELSKFSGELAGASLVYDLDALATTWGVHFPNVKAYHDVQVAEPLIDEWRDSYTLDSISKDYLGEGKDETILKEAAAVYGASTNEQIKRCIWKMPAAYVGAYAEGDVDRPLRILPHQFKKLTEENLDEIYTIERKLIPILLAMRLRGVQVNVEQVEYVKEQLSFSRDAALARVRAIAGPHAELMAPDSFVPAFIERGITPNLTAGSGKPKKGGGVNPDRYSVTQDWLESLPNEPLAIALLEGRRIDYIINTFINGHLITHPVNGRIHAEFNQLKGEGGGTIARFSSSNPNLQNLPQRDDELGPLVRGLFLPNEGEDWQRDDYCVASETRILTSDLKHIPANKIKVGDELIGFDEIGPVNVHQARYRRPLKLTKVIKIKKLVQPCYEVKTDKGGFVVSAKHRWLAKHAYPKTYKWVETKDLQKGTMIPRICGIWDTETSFDAGWLAGIFDGEGWRIPGQLCVAQNPGTVLDRIRNVLEKFGYSYRYRKVHSNIVESLTIEGGRPEVWRLLGSIRPVRLLEKNYSMIPLESVQSRCAKADIVKSIKFIGEREVVAIQTTTGTFVANGLASHNSQIEYRLLTHFAVGTGAEEARQRYRDDPETDFHKFCQEMIGQENIGRKHVKGINFCKVYGGGIKRIASVIGTSFEAAQDFTQQYDRELPFVKKTLETAMYWAGKQGYVTTILGRRQRFPLWEKSGWGESSKPLPHAQALEWYGPNIKRYMTYAALNRKNQGSSADITKKAMVDSWEAKLQGVIGAPLVTVHDENGASIPKTKEGDEAGRELTRIMEKAVVLKVPVYVSSKRGANWGEVS